MWLKLLELTESVQEHSETAFFHFTCLSITFSHYVSLSIPFPVSGRFIIIVPIFKSGDRTSITNYRPISLLCITSKVFEHLIYNKVYPFLLSSITPAQYGFLKGHSCLPGLQQLLTFLSEVHKCTDRSHQADIIYLHW